MQTFLGEDTFRESVKVLDNIRLNKQMLEGYQILNAISLTPAGPRTVKINGRYPFASNHPATNQWRGSEGILYSYLVNVRDECISRGIKWDKNWSNIMRVYGYSPELINNDFVPEWWSDTQAQNRVLLTHRYNLYHKDPVWYAAYSEEGGMSEDDLMKLVCCPHKHAPYYYPTHDKEYQ